MPNPDLLPPEPVAVPLPDPAAAAEAPMPVQLDDRAAMTLGSLGFGLSIPWLTGLYGALTPGQGMFWAGQLLFIALAYAIWAGNRWLLLRQREHWNWFGQPLRKLSALVAANVLYTAPVTVAGLLAWSSWSGQTVDARTLQLVTLTNVICVLFVTHAYETLFLIREREGDLTRVERLQRLRAQAELASLKAQVDPHFLFNSLNVLGHLIGHDGARAREFCDTLAEVYRYVLDSRSRDLVPLAEELDFVRRYHRLLELRFGAAMPLAGVDALAEEGRRWRIAPMALQGLVENAVKHNQASQAEPLVLQLGLRDGAVSVANARRPRRSALPSAGVGLVNLDERCRLLTGRPLEVSRGASTFSVSVPLLPAAA